MSKIFDNIAKANEIREQLKSFNDEQLIQDMIEGETDLYKILDWAIAKVGDERAMQESIKLRMGSLKARSDASIKREGNMKAIVKQIMDAIGERKYTAAEATIFFSDVKPVNVIDENYNFPEKYYKIEKKLDKTAVKKAIENGDIEEGFHLSNGDEKFTVRFN